MNKRLEDLLTEDQIQSIRAPIEKARTFPREAFFSDSFFQLEVDKIYSRHWVALAFECDIPAVGDAVPIELCGMPLFAVRAPDRTVRVFHNIVPYDGCLALIDAANGLERIETPYHGWSYDLEGRLVATPYWDGTRAGDLKSVAGRDVDLVPVHAETFLGMIFVNLRGDPAPFDAYIAPILREFEEYDFRQAVVATDRDGRPILLESSARTNWKTYFENACINVLHENFVHELYRNSPHHPRIVKDGVKSFFEIHDQYLLGLGYRFSDFAETYGELQIPHLGKSEARPEKSAFATLYPNFYISPGPYYVEVGFALPDRPERTFERRYYLVHRKAVASPTYAQVSKEVFQTFSEAAIEDYRICEAVQKARRSPVYSQKFYSPFWDELHYRFNQLLIKDLA